MPSPPPLPSPSSCRRSRAGYAVRIQMRRPSAGRASEGGRSSRSGACRASGGRTPGSTPEGRRGLARSPRRAPWGRTRRARARLACQLACVRRHVGEDDRQACGEVGLELPRVGMTGKRRGARDVRRGSERGACEHSLDVAVIRNEAVESHRGPAESAARVRRCAFFRAGADDVERDVLEPRDRVDERHQPLARDEVAQEDDASSCVRVLRPLPGCGRAKPPWGRRAGAPRPSSRWRRSRASRAASESSTRASAVCSKAGHGGTAS